MISHTLTAKELKRARLARDPRFDGLFFIAVKSTGIYCRPICPAQLPKEENVQYYGTAIEAANEGYRPCLRCRPDSAPGSNPWLGTETTFARAIRLIDEGYLTQHSLEALSEKLGVSDRYLRKLFQQYLGVSPKSYALYQQCLFAKQLLHESGITITEVALASGFNSVRRFNDCFKTQIGIKPSDIRRNKIKADHQFQLRLNYRPPFNWSQMLAFLEKRQISGLESVKGDRYSRTFSFEKTCGSFSISPVKNAHALNLELTLDRHQHLNVIVKRIRHLFDLDCNSFHIDQQLKSLLPEGRWVEGLRIPKIASLFEAGVRAILGQQVTVQAAQNLVTQLVAHLGTPWQTDQFIFPTAHQVLNSSLDFLKMPRSRHNTLKSFSEWYVSPNRGPIESILELKGIGPWTLDYILLRGIGDPDIWLSGDSGIKNALKQNTLDLNPDDAKPWRSYLTFQVWSLL